MSWSVRERILVGGGALLLLSLGGMALLIYLDQRRALWHEFDAGLLAQARAQAAMIHFEDVSMADKPSEPTTFGSTQRGLLEIRSGERILARSPGIDQPLPSAATPTALTIADESWRSVGVGFSATIERGTPPAPDSPPTRFRFRLGNQESPYQDAIIHPDQRLTEAEIPVSLTLVLAMSAVGIEHEIDQLAARVLLAVLVTLVCGLAALAWIVHLALSPMRALADRINAFGHADEALRPLPLVGIPAELTPLVDRLNQLLRRLDAVMERERAFSADIAHELRTPLTGLRTAIDVCLRRDRDAETYRTTIEESRRICGQLQGMVTNLLELARLDRPAHGSGTGSGAHAQLATVADLPLEASLRSAWSQVADRAKDQRLSLEISVPPILVTADAERLERILINLFDNAVNHADQGGRISLSAAVGGGRVRLRIANTGSRIPAEDAGRVFDRYWRGQRARSGLGIQIGLGLCLCQRLVASLGGTIAATSVLGGEFVIRIDLPGRAGTDPFSQVESPVAPDSAP